MKSFNMNITAKNKNLIKNIAIFLYIFFVLAFTVTSKAAPDVMPIFTDHKQLETQIIEGQIFVDLDKVSFLVTSDNSVYQMAANIEMEEFNGSVVQIEGVILNSSVDPVLRVDSNNPLHVESARKIRHSIMAVLGINILSSVK